MLHVVLNQGCKIINLNSVSNARWYGYIDIAIYKGIIISRIFK